MASRCGCAGTCACILSVDAPLALSGNGSAASPWRLRIVEDCTTTADCVADMIDQPLEMNAGRLGVNISGDTNQALTTGTDGGLYVSTASSGAVVSADTATIDFSGTGQAATPLTANWLGAVTDNNPDTGVQLLGTGTTADPLTPNWSGVRVSAINPEMTVSGTGTPASPMVFAWGGLPWIRFKQNPLSINTGVTDVQVLWANDAGHGVAPLALKAGDAHQLTCLRSGAYIMLIRLRLLLTAANTTNGGYFQAKFMTAPSTLNSDYLVSTYGAGWVDLYATECVQLTSGINYLMTLNNFTGSNGTGGYVYWTFFRISD